MFTRSREKSGFSFSKYTSKETGPLYHTLNITGWALVMNSAQRLAKLRTEAGRIEGELKNFTAAVESAQASGLEIAPKAFERQNSALESIHIPQMAPSYPGIGKLED